MSAQNLDFIRGVYAAYNRGDFEGFVGAFHPDIEWRFAENFIYGQVNPIIGRDNVRNGSLRALAEEWEGFGGELDELLDAGDEIIGLGHYVGVNRATGKRLRAQFAHIWKVRGDKTVRWRQYTDTLQFADIAGRRGD